VLDAATGRALYMQAAIKGDKPAAT